MCGIIGYTGYKNAANVLIKGLKKLEYRGYDSAGIAVLGEENIICKKAGKVEVLEHTVKNTNIQGGCGIGHTRWATHGEPNDINSHPHKSGQVTLVHNGIIENYRELKKQLENTGRTFISDTDTEVISHLIDSLYKGDPLKAIYQTITQIRGSFALGIMFDNIPDTLFAIRRDSPLIIGIGDGENFIASDLTAILPHTKNYYLCDEDEAVVITKSSIRFTDRDGEIHSKHIHHSQLTEQDTQKGGYEYFMLKEIHEQPSVIRKTVNNTEMFEGICPDIKGRIHIVACGSAMHAAMLGKYAIEKLARIPVNTDIASEFRYSDPILNKNDLVIAISQSGETADTIAALSLAKKRGAQTLAIVNIRGSTLAREADKVIYTLAGPEICVATTKAYLCQITVLYMLAFEISKSIIGSQKYSEYMKMLLNTPEYIEKALETKEKCKQLAKQNYKSEDVFFIGRGQDLCVCAEGSLKLKEISYIHSEAYAAGELKHGTISLVTTGTLIIAVMTDRERIPKTISNIKEAVSRGAKAICITYPDVDVSDFCTHKIEIEAPCCMLAPIIASIPLQLFAYYTAKERGNDVDKPRNLAKSVTVE